jgi:hypothetical protein
MITIFENTVNIQTPTGTTEIMTTKTSPYLFTNTPTHIAFITEEVFFTSDAEEEYYSVMYIYEKSTFDNIFIYYFNQPDANWISSFSNPNHLYIGFVNYIYKYDFEANDVFLVAHTTNLFSSMTVKDDKIVSLSRNGTINVWGDNPNEPEREHKLHNRRMASAIFAVDDKYFVWTHTTSSRTQQLSLLDREFNSIQEIILPASSYSYIYNVSDTVFFGVKHWTKGKELAIIRIGDDIDIRNIPFEGRFIDPSIPIDGKLLVDKKTSYEWFNIHTYETEPCEWLKNNISFYALPDK